MAAVVFARFASTELCARRGVRFYVLLVGNIYVIFLLQAFPGMSTGILLSYLTSGSMTEVPADQRSTAMVFFRRCTPSV